MKSHWENIYDKKGDEEVSWYQEVPITSLELVNKYSASKEDKIIDVGAGNANLIIELVDKEYSNLSALDISKNALKRTKNKLGSKAEKISWIVSDILEYKSDEEFTIWHDRAVFHFLTKEEDIKIYSDLMSDKIKKGGVLILATFSKEGPLKCSGLEISQYNKEGLIDIFGEDFELLESFTENHITPFETNQDFIYTVWRRK